MTSGDYRDGRGGWNGAWSEGFCGAVWDAKASHMVDRVVCGEDYLDASSDVTDDNRNIN